MTRIDRRRLDDAVFPSVIEIQTRFDDLDMQGHVNNTAVVVILQEARATFNRQARLGSASQGLRFMVAALNVEYAAELHYPAPAAVHTGLLAVGRTSLTVAQVLRQNGKPAAYALTVIVVADAGGPVPVPPALRAAYEQKLLP